MQRIEPIRPRFSLEVLTPGQLAEIRAAVFHVLEHVGVHFPSERALGVFAQHGATVDWDRQVVQLPPYLVSEAMSRAPRFYNLSGRAPGTGLTLDGTATYFGTDGCGTRTVDFETGEERRSCKEDVAHGQRPGPWAASAAARAGR